MKRSSGQYRRVTQAHRVPQIIADNWENSSDLVTAVNRKQKTVKKLVKKGVNRISISRVYIEDSRRPLKDDNSKGGK